MRAPDYAKGTEPFANHLRVYPLAAPDGVISHFLGVLKDIGADGADGSGGARAPCAAAAQADKQPAAAAAAAVEGGAAETCA